MMINGPIDNPNDEDQHNNPTPTVTPTPSTQGVPPVGEDE
jgi:hypothetical protein